MIFCFERYNTGDNNTTAIMLYDREEHDGNMDPALKEHRQGQEAAKTSLDMAKINRVIELKKAITQMFLERKKNKDDGNDGIDGGWYGFKIAADGCSVMANRIGKDPGDMVSKDEVRIYKPEGPWAKVAQDLKIQEEYRRLYGELTEEEFEEYLRLTKKEQSLN